jgi:hypothetical protein
MITTILNYLVLYNIQKITLKNKNKGCKYQILVKLYNKEKLQYGLEATL